MVWPEVLTTNTVGRDALAVEIILTDSINDASTDNHSITAFSDPTFTTLTRSYARKISYGFTESPNNPAFEQLWSLEYIDTTDNETVDRCTTPDAASGWALTDSSDWLITADDAFSLDDGVISLNAEVATAIGEKQISVGNSNFILAGQGLDSSELCKIAPSMAGFNTGGNKSKRLWCGSMMISSRPKRMSSPSLMPPALVPPPSALTVTTRPITPSRTSRRKGGDLGEYHREYVPIQGHADLHINGR